MSRLVQAVKGLSGEGLLRFAATGASVALTVKILGTGIAYLSHLAFAQWLGAAEYGSYVYAVSWAKLLALLSGLGLTTAVLRFVPSYLENRDYSRLNGILRRSRQLTVLAAVLLAALASLVVLILRPEQVNMTTLLAALWLVPALALASLQAETILAARRIVLARLPNLVIQPALCIGLAFLLLKLFPPLSSALTLGAFALSVVVLVILQNLAFRRVFQRQTHASHPAYETRHWLRISFPLFLITGFELIMLRADILIVGMFRGDAGAGIYNIAAQTATLISFAFAAVNTATAPLITNLHAKRDRSSLQSLVTAASKWMWWPALGICVIVVVWGKYILSLFGPEFVAGWAPLVVLSVGHLAKSSVGPAMYLLSLTGEQKLTAWILGLAALLSILLNVMLIPRWGLVGAASATTAAMLGMNAGLHYAVKARLGIHSFILAPDTSRSADR